MKGTLHKKEQGWVVRYLDSEKAYDIMYCGESLPLHPDDANLVVIGMDNMGVEFEIVEEYTDDITMYAKLINQVPDVRKMVEDDVEKHISFMKDAGVHEDDIKNWVKGYNKAKKTLYTEEQMIGFAEWILNSDSKKVLTRTKESLLKEYIESLKQAKKD